MPIKKSKIYYYFYLFFVTVFFVIIPGYFDVALGGGGPEPEKTAITAVPPGYKLVAVDDECKKKDPCASLKAENAKLKAEIKRLEGEIRDFECPDCPKCPKQEVKTVYVDKVREVPVEKKVEVEKPMFKRNVVRILGAIGQDGIDTSSSPSDPYAEDATVYWNGLGGIGYTRFFDDSFGLGLFGMMGGINKTAGVSVEFAF